MAGPKPKEAEAIQVAPVSAPAPSAQAAENIGNMEQAGNQAMIEEFMQREKVTRSPVAEEEQKRLEKRGHLGRIVTREEGAAARAAMLEEVGMGEGPGGLTSRPRSGRASQGRDDYQGALRQLAFEEDGKRIPKKVSANLRAQLKRLYKLMADGKYDESLPNHKLKLPNGYVLGHYEDKEYKGIVIEGTTARAGFDYNNARVITVKQNQKEERQRQERERRKREQSKAPKTAPLSKAEIKEKIAPRIRKQGAEDSKMTATPAPPIKPAPKNLAPLKNTSPDAQKTAVPAPVLVRSGETGFYSETPAQETARGGQPPAAQPVQVKQEPIASSKPPMTAPPPVRRRQAVVPSQRLLKKMPSLGRLQRGSRWTSETRGQGALIVAEALQRLANDLSEAGIKYRTNKELEERRKEIADYQIANQSEGVLVIVTFSRSTIHDMPRLLESLIIQKGGATEEEAIARWQGPSYRAGGGQNVERWDEFIWIPPGKYIPLSKSNFINGRYQSDSDPSRMIWLQFEDSGAFTLKAWNPESGLSYRVEIGEWKLGLDDHSIRLKAKFQHPTSGVKIESEFSVLDAEWIQEVWSANSGKQGEFLWHKTLH